MSWIPRFAYPIHGLSRHSKVLCLANSTQKLAPGNVLPLRISQLQPNQRVVYRNEEGYLKTTRAKPRMVLNPTGKPISVESGEGRIHANAFPTPFPITSLHADHHQDKNFYEQLSVPWFNWTEEIDQTDSWWELDAPNYFVVPSPSTQTDFGLWVKNTEFTGWDLAGLFTPSQNLTPTTTLMEHP